MTEKTSLELEGFGRLDVTPGGDDVRTRRARVEELQSNLSAALEQRQYRSVGEAEAAFRRKSDKRKEMEKAEARLAGIAPDGLEELRNAIAGRREELAPVRPIPPPSISIEKARGVEAETASEEAEADAEQSRPSGNGAED